MQSTLLGLLLHGSPRDGQMLSGPAMASGIPYASPYLDIDLIEYFASIPLRYRISFRKSPRLPLVLAKRPFRQLARELFGFDDRLPKKPLIVPMNRDSNSERFYESLPSQFAGNELKDINQRYAAHVFGRWTKLQEIDSDPNWWH